MRLTRTILGFAAAACFTLTPAYADHGQKPTANPTTIHGQSTADPATTTAGNQKPKTTTSKNTTGKTSKTTTSKTTTKTQGTQSKTVQKSKTTTTSTTTQLNPIAAKISTKPNLNAKITAMLPTVNGKTMSLNYASKGFRNQGQFIAALHASQRMDCGTASCFKLIKADMVGKNMSLGQSIQDVKHTSSTTASSEATKAEHEAEHDLDNDDHHDSHHRESEHERREANEFGHGNKLAKVISRNPQLNAKVAALLPTGMTLKKAAKGFSSETQFLAALHASRDLGISFTRLKAEMTGHDHDSLTQAIRELKPSVVDARAAAKTAQQEASADIKSTQIATNTDH